ncbi:hypothetical protein IF2G_10732 [Cordyceps javanica]|nr:hypothetical protein IF2G_10732 [Cordyceps javanica]
MASEAIHTLSKAIEQAKERFAVLQADDLVNVANSMAALDARSTEHEKKLVEIGCKMDEIKELLSNLVSRLDLSEKAAPYARTLDLVLQSSGLWSTLKTNKKKKKITKMIKQARGLEQLGMNYGFPPRYPKDGVFSFERPSVVEQNEADGKAADLTADEQ